MYRTNSSAEDWERLVALATGKHVIQIGYGYGHDTARLAATAISVTVTDQAEELAHTGYASPVEQWHEILMFHHLRSKCFYMPRTWQLLYGELIPGSFDLAVIDLPALDPVNLPEVINFALFCAPEVAVLEGALMRTEEIRDAAKHADREWMKFGQVNTITAHPAPTLAEAY